MLTTISLLASLAAASQDTVGLLVVAHGADSAWNARVHATMTSVKWTGPVGTAFLMGSEAASRSWDAGIADLIRRGASRIVVVPLMVSSHGSHVREIEFYAGKRAALPAELESHAGHASMARPTVPVTVTRAIDNAAELGEIIADRWATLPPRDRSRPLVLIGHGPNDDADVGAWLDGIREATRRVERQLEGRTLHVGLLRDDAPAQVRAAAVQSLRDTITALAAGDSVTVMTVLVSSGTIDRVRIPSDLAGMPMRYVGVSLAPHPALARWIERVAAQASVAAFNDTRTSDHTRR